MTGRLNLISPPAVEPVTLDEAVQQCRATIGDEDDWFLRAIRTARETAEGYQRRAYITQTWGLTFDNLPDLPILLPRPPLAKVESVKLYDTASVATTMLLTDLLIDTDAEPGRISLGYGKDWPPVDLRESSGVKVEYTAGYGGEPETVPDTVRSAILLHVAWAYENRSGEAGELSRHFYDLLRPDRMFL